MANMTTHFAQGLRQFSHRATPPNSRLKNALAMGAITTGTVAPFIPPALESQKEAKAGYPNTGSKVASLYCHGR